MRGGVAVVVVAAPTTHRFGRYARAFALAEVWNFCHGPAVEPSLPFSAAGWLGAAAAAAAAALARSTHGSKSVQWYATAVDTSRCRLGDGDDGPSPASSLENCFPVDATAGGPRTANSTAQSLSRMALVSLATVSNSSSRSATCAGTPAAPSLPRPRRRGGGAASYSAAESCRRFAMARACRTKAGLGVVEVAAAAGSRVTQQYLGGEVIE